MLHKVFRNWTDIGWWRGTAVPFLYKNVMRKYYDRFGPDGCSIMDEDWDTLLLLDACRYDFFEATNWLDGTLDSRVSKGSATPEFLKANFDGRTHQDTVYVTASPVYRQHGIAGTFHKTIDVWLNRWDDDLHTVRPESMVSATREAIDAFPNKRLLVHFVQPHYPFIGQKGRALGEHSGLEYTYRAVNSQDAARDGPVIWDLLRKGVVTHDEVREAYRENLELVLASVESLVKDLDGKTVISSDHGNMFGELASPFPFPVYGHPGSIHTKKLVKVPWFEIEAESRRRIRAGASTDEQTSVDNETVTGRLADLGYTE